ncbi:crossover junction endodeoxyribonuclease RuvC [Brevibacillus daliensis]|uniref:crossover junction endodeoxyribonuclease RuvC n=1 Tax=Brevibacillus daliensis TaxID=2892995 RepID=UPI001E38F21A|nr:crossover junction endodeoxyribonuclease RuvC [Brevibacillus daliensis]
MAKRKQAEPAARYLGLDISLNPGFAVIDVKNRVPTLIHASSLVTATTHTDGQRFAYIEAKTVATAHDYGPFTAIIREDFTDGRSKRARQGVFGAWAAVDQGLGRYGYVVTDDIAPTAVKRHVTGNGKAEKAEVAATVRKYLRLPDDYTFAAGYDDSDACGIILAHLIANKLIDVEGAV